MPYQYQLDQKLALPLESKVRLAMMRIKAWYQYWDGEGLVVLDDGFPEARVLRGLVHELDSSIPVVAPGGVLLPMRLIVPFRVCTSPRNVDDWLKYGCNAYLSTPPRCRPLSVWLDEDVRLYLNEVKGQREALSLLTGSGA